MFRPPELTRQKAKEGIPYITIILIHKLTSMAIANAQHLPMTMFNE